MFLILDELDSEAERLRARLPELEAKLEARKHNSSMLFGCSLVYFIVLTRRKVMLGSPY